jgi:hypothetical protein
MQHFAQAGESFIKILNEHLRLMQLLRIPGGEFDTLDLLLRGLLVIAAEALSVTGPAFGKGLHGGSYPLPPGGLSQAPLHPESLFSSGGGLAERKRRAKDPRANPFK